MPGNRREDDLIDDSPTDELPMLIDTDNLSEAIFEAAGGDARDATGRHPLVPDAPALTAGPTDSEIAILETRLAEAVAARRAVEARLADKDGELLSLTRMLGDLKVALDARASAEHRLVLENQERDARIATLEGELDSLRRAKAAADEEAERVRAERKALEEKLAAVPADVTAADPIALQTAREEIAALRTYIDGAHDRWRRTEARCADQARKIAELEREIERGAEGRRAAEDLAQREADRAVRLRAELAAESRTVEELKAALSRARSSEPNGGHASLRRELGRVTEHAARLERELADARERSASVRASDERQRPSDAQADAATAQAAQDLENAQRALAAAAERTAALEGQIAALRAELATAEAARSADASEHERAIAAKERRLDEFELRIVVLQQELDKKLGALQRLNAMDLTVSDRDARLAERVERPSDPIPDPAGTPALLCLTGDAPSKYLLQKKAVTIGRSSTCDIQVLTHFVSREHARVLVGRDEVTVEDLGSTNGVFVNSIRVDRQTLKHADLLTIGETQFRFVESVAH